MIEERQLIFHILERTNIQTNGRCKAMWGHKMAIGRKKRKKPVFCWSIRIAWIKRNETLGLIEGCRKIKKNVELQLVVCLCVILVWSRQVVINTFSSLLACQCAYGRAIEVHRTQVTYF